MVVARGVKRDGDIDVEPPREFAWRHGQQDRLSATVPGLSHHTAIAGGSGGVTHPNIGNSRGQVWHGH
jgi:hypothetical protein